MRTDPSHPKAAGATVRQKMVSGWELILALGDVGKELDADRRARSAALTARVPPVNVQYEFSGCPWLKVIIKDGDLRFPWFERASVLDVLKCEGEGLLTHLAHGEMATLYEVDDRVWIKPIPSVDVVSLSGLFKLDRLTSRGDNAFWLTKYLQWELLPAIRKGNLPPPPCVTAQNIYGSHDFRFEGDVVRAHAWALDPSSASFKLVDIGRIGRINDLRSFESEVYDWCWIETMEDVACLAMSGFKEVIEAGLIGDPDRLLRLADAYQNTGRDEAYWAAQSRIRRDTQAGGLMTGRRGTSHDG